MGRIIAIDEIGGLGFTVYTHPFFTVHPNGELYLCTHSNPTGEEGFYGFAYKSLDYGATWSLVVSSDNAFTDSYPEADEVRVFLIMTKTSAGYVLVTYGAGNGGVFFSSTGAPGSFVRKYETSLMNVEDLYCVNNSASYVFTSAGVISGTLNYEVYRSTDGGANWSNVFSNNDSTLRVPHGKIRFYDTYVFVASGASGAWEVLGRSASSGDSGSWSYMGHSIRRVSYGWAGGGKIWGTLIGEWDYFWFSDDYGATENTKDRPTDLKGVDFLNLNYFDTSTVDGDLIGVVYGGTFYKSTDWGDSWNSYTVTGATALIGLYFDRTNSSIVYAVDNTKGFFRSTDGGVTWAASNSGIEL